MVSRKMAKHYHYSPAAISSSESIDMNHTSEAAQLPRPSRSRLAALPVLGLLLTLALAGCAGHAKGVMAPVAMTGATGGSTVDMLVVTSRVPSHDPATLFTGERSPTPYLTDITVSIPSDAKRKAGTVQWPKKVPPNPETDFAVTKVQQLHSPEEGRAWFRQHVVNGHAMVFVHGFNNRYEDSVFRFAQIIHDSKAQVTPILFTWPSRARVFDYNYDKESTNFSRTALRTGTANACQGQGRQGNHGHGPLDGNMARHGIAAADGNTRRPGAAQDKECDPCFARYRCRCLRKAMERTWQGQAENHHLRVPGRQGLEGVAVDLGRCRSAWCDQSGGGALQDQAGSGRNNRRRSDQGQNR